MPPQIAAARPSTATRGRPSFKAAGLGARAGGQSTFKPPRPQAPEKQQKNQKEPNEQSKQTGKRPQDRIDVDENVVDLEDEEAESSRRRGKKREVSGAADDLAAFDDMDEDEADDDADSGASSIPPELLTRLLHHFFSKPNSRITQDANTSVGKYMEIFIREAVARSMAERRDGGFLDVDVLQKVAAQLIMDM